MTCCTNLATQNENPMVIDTRTQVLQTWHHKGIRSGCKPPHRTASAARERGEGPITAREESPRNRAAFPVTKVTRPKQCTQKRMQEKFTDV